jgi:hypothetical protein
LGGFGGAGQGGKCGELATLSDADWSDFQPGKPALAAEETRIARARRCRSGSASGEIPISSGASLTEAGEEPDGRGGDVQAFATMAGAGMTLVGAVIWIAAGAAALSQDKDDAPVCRPIPEASTAVSALNAFWRRAVRLCESPDPDESAVALPEYQTVEANRRWLAQVARDYGAPAAIGILAHEWAHMAHPSMSGPAGELYADCLAGAFLRWNGYGKAAVERFALLSLHSGDDGESLRSHGSGRQRRAAVLRGYGQGRNAGTAQAGNRCRR